MFPRYLGRVVLDAFFFVVSYLLSPVCGLAVRCIRRLRCGVGWTNPVQECEDGHIFGLPLVAGRSRWSPIDLIGIMFC